MIVLIRLSKEIPSWLDTYGPLEGEVSWTRKRKTAFRMKQVQAETRLKVLHASGFLTAIIEPETT